MVFFFFLGHAFSLHSAPRKGGFSDQGGKLGFQRLCRGSRAIHDFFFEINNRVVGSFRSRLRKGTGSYQADVLLDAT